MAASRLNCIIIYNILLKEIKIYDKIYLQNSKSSVLKLIVEKEWSSVYIYGLPKKSREEAMRELVTDQLRESQCTKCPISHASKGSKGSKGTFKGSIHLRSVPVYHVTSRF